MMTDDSQAVLADQQRSEDVIVHSRRMICGKTSYLVQGTLAAGQQAALHDADGPVILVATNLTRVERQLRARRVLHESAALRLIVDHVT